jgi:hypothetical protein
MQLDVLIPTFNRAASLSRTFDSLPSLLGFLRQRIGSRPVKSTNHSG